MTLEKTQKYFSRFKLFAKSMKLVHRPEFENLWSKYGCHLRYRSPNGNGSSLESDYLKNKYSRHVEAWFPSNFVMSATHRGHCYWRMFPYTFHSPATHRGHCYWRMFPYTFHSLATHRRWALLRREFQNETEMKVIPSSIAARWTSETAGDPPAIYRS